MSPARGFAAVAVALVAGLGLTYAVSDVGGGDQRIETAPDGNEEALDAAQNDSAALVPLVNADNPAVLSVPSEPTPAGPSTSEAPALEVEVDQSDSAQVNPADDPDADIPTANDAADDEAPTDASANQNAASSGPTATAAPQATTPAPTSAPDSAANQNQPEATNPPATEATTTTQGPTTNPPTTQAPTTQAPTTNPPTTQAPTTQAPTTQPSGGGDFEAIRNRDPLFNRYANVRSDQLPVQSLTEPAPRPDNGGHPDGNFRMACAYSHFSYDDPIVFPGQPGRSHLHMFFGNTAVDAYTTTDSLVNSGGGSCNGFELNRSGYWTPAVLDGQGNAVVPDSIILYYKTKDPSSTVAMPQGLKMIAGNPRNEDFTAGQRLGWSCGSSGHSYNISNRIPTNCGNDPINAYIQFPFCWDGQNLDSSDHISHMAFTSDHQSCPASHPVRLPQITILLYFPPGDSSSWYLSSDRSGGFNTGPGATLHADWFGGWNDEAMNLWIDGCIRASRNCSYGQTGTARQFTKLNPLQTYQGPNFLPLP